MANEYEVKKVPKVIVQSIKPGQLIQPTPANQYWFVVESVKTGERYSEHDEESDAIAECERLNSGQ